MADPGGEFLTSTTLDTFFIVKGVLVVVVLRCASMFNCLTVATAAAAAVILGALMPSLVLLVAPEVLNVPAADLGRLLGKADLVGVLAPAFTCAK